MKSGETLTADDVCFLRNGRRHQIISGAVHYFRIHPDLWEDRLRRLRSMGLNTVETYIAWNFHEVAPGVFDFAGWRDVEKFLLTAQRCGLDVIVRPGPYICAEWEFGGLPARLLADHDMKLRCSDPRYLAEVDRWFDSIIPRLVPLLVGNGGPIAAMQVENEYGSYGNDANYLRHVREGLVDRGVDCLLFTSDGDKPWMLQAGMVPGVLATVNFGDAGSPEESLGELREHQPHGPAAVMELWVGRFAHWGFPHYIRDPEKSVPTLETLLAAGVSVNIFMAHGGTNFGFWAGANHVGAELRGPGYKPVITSYDYDAPVGEAGELTSTFHAFRAAIGKYAQLPDEPLPAPLPRQQPQSFAATGSVSLADSYDALSRVIHRVTPEPMERLGQSFGLIHYRTEITGPRSLPLRIDGLADRAYIDVNGRRLGVLDRNTPDYELLLEVDSASAVLEILVEATGRIGFGPFMEDRKGIVGGVRHGQQKLFGWDIRPLRLDDLSGVRFGPVTPSTGPRFYKFEPIVAEPADGFLALPGWSRGLLWLNGFLLGRYRACGPQQTYYAPGPLWRAGVNEVVVLELEQSGDLVEIRDQPDLGRTPRPSGGTGTGT